jgi:hypothetical protein
MTHPGANGWDKLPNTGREPMTPIGRPASLKNFTINYMSDKDQD